MAGAQLERIAAIAKRRCERAGSSTSSCMLMEAIPLLRWRSAEPCGEVCASAVLVAACAEAEIDCSERDAALDAVMDAPEHCRRAKPDPD